MKKRFLSLVLTLVLICSVIPGITMTVSAEKEHLGSIDSIELTISCEPAVSKKDGSKILFEAAVPENETGYSVCTEGNQPQEYFRNGVSWYDVTDGRYVTDPGWQYYEDGNFIVGHEFRVEIAVIITGSLIDKNAWFSTYGEGDSWSSTVNATINGYPATVSKHTNYRLGQALIVSYTFGPTLPKDKREIWIAEATIDTPYGGRKVPYTAKTGGLQKGYTVSKNYNKANDGYIKGISWFDKTTGEYLKEGDVFITGHTYQVYIKLTVDDVSRHWFNIYEGYLNGFPMSKEGYLNIITKDSYFMTHTFENITEAPADRVSFQVYSLAGPFDGFDPSYFTGSDFAISCDNGGKWGACELLETNNEFFSSGVKWVHTETWEPLEDGEPFEAGELYTVLIPVRAKDPFRFSVSETDSGIQSDMWAEFIPEIGDSIISTSVYYPFNDNRSDRELLIQIDFPKCKIPVMYPVFTVTGPEENKSPSYNVISDYPTLYSARNVVWYDDTNEHVMTKDELFKADHKYSVLFDVVSAKNADFLMGYGNVNPKLNRDGKTYQVVLDGQHECTLSYLPEYLDDKDPWNIFHIDCDMGLCNDSVVEELSLYIPEPVPGEHPSYDAVNLGSGYHIDTDWEGKTEEWWHDPVTYAYYGKNGVQWYPEGENAPEHLYETDTFVAGQKYTAVIYVEADEGYEFYSDGYGGVLATASVNGNAAKIIDGAIGSKTYHPVYYTFTCSAEGTYSISGMIQSYGGADKEITVQLIPMGQAEAAYSDTTFGTYSQYSIGNVSPGSYTLKVSKPGHRSASFPITVSSENITFDVTLELLDSASSYTPCTGGDDCPGKIFTDMPPKGHWAHDAIDWAIVNNITAGTSTTTFSPDNGCTRAQVVTFLWRAAGSPVQVAGTNPFRDVKSDAYYYDAVLWAVANDITKGTSATTFSPNSTCTRGQIVTFLWRFENEPSPASSYNPFTDVKTDAYYYDAVLWASGCGVTTGTSDTTFSPDATCTRAHVVTFLYRDMMA